MIPYLKLVAVGVVLAIVVAAFLYGRSVGIDSVLADQAREDKLVAKVTEASQKAAAVEISKIEIRQTTIRQRVEREILKEPYYVDCRHSDDAFGLLNSALSGEAGAEPVDRGFMPEADTPAR